MVFGWPLVVRLPRGGAQEFARLYGPPRGISIARPYFCSVGNSSGEEGDEIQVRTLPLGTWSCRRTRTNVFCCPRCVRLCRQNRTSRVVFQFFSLPQQERWEQEFRLPSFQFQIARQKLNDEFQKVQRGLLQGDYQQVESHDHVIFENADEPTPPPTPEVR